MLFWETFGVIVSIDSIPDLILIETVSRCKQTKVKNESAKGTSLFCLYSTASY